MPTWQPRDYCNYKKQLWARNYKNSCNSQSLKFQRHVRVRSFLLYSMSASDNKRIAKNTLFLYVRMIVIMLVTLYTSRVVLSELGVDNYGVYSIVGGIVGVLGFLNISMSAVTQRFLNYEMGVAGVHSNKLAAIFSTSISIHSLICVIVLVISETLGLWFLNSKLVIPQESIVGANVVFQTSVLSFCIAVMRVPFNATIIAHEKMDIYAYISVLEAILLLLSAYALNAVGSSKLTYYGLFVLGVNIIVAILYMCCCKHFFRECSFHIKLFSHQLFSEMIRFAGWNLLGSLSWIIRGQGLGIILNLFYGPVLNAAKGIADQILNAVNAVTNNFQTALNPQITKSYASNHIEEMQQLVFRGLKFSCFLVWIVALPLIISISEILSLWLTTVPPLTSIFAVLILIDCLISCLFGSPLVSAISATGRIRNMQIVSGGILLLILPTSYLALKFGISPQVIFIFNIIFNFLSGLSKLYYSSVLIAFSIKKYLSITFLPVLGVTVTSSIVPFLFKCLLLPSHNISDILSFLILSITSVACVIICTWMMGLSSNERVAVKGLISKHLRRYN